jgi:hypothetical protein
LGVYSKSEITDLKNMYTVFIVQAYQTSQYVVTRAGIFLGKWRSSFAGSSDGKMNVQSACALNSRYIALGYISCCCLYSVLLFNISAVLKQWFPENSSIV